MTALVLQPYSSSAFNTLPSLRDADAEFKGRNAGAIMNSNIASIFAKHNVNDFLGIQLLHRHFSLNSDERLVDVGGASVPWSNGGSEALDSCILPVSWAFEGNTYHPYEFKFVPPTQELHKPVLPEPFVIELNETLKAHNLQGVLGIRVLKTGQGKKPEMEITKGRSNITFDVDYDSDATEDANVIQASWAFGGTSVAETRYCTSYCRGSDYDNHNNFHDHYIRKD